MINKPGERGTSRFSRMKTDVHALDLWPRRAHQRLAHNAAGSIAFRLLDNVGTPKKLISRLNSPAYTHPYQRFATPSRNVDAWLGATAGR